VALSSAAAGGAPAAGRRPGGRRAPPRRCRPAGACAARWPRASCPPESPAACMLRLGPCVPEAARWRTPRRELRVPSGAAPCALHSAARLQDARARAAADRERAPGGRDGGVVVAGRAARLARLCQGARAARAALCVRWLRQHRQGASPEPPSAARAPWAAARSPCAAPPRVCVMGWSKLARWCGRARGHVPGAALVQRAAQRFRMCSAAPSRPPLPTPAQAPACCCRTSG